MEYTSILFVLFVGITTAVYFLFPVKKYQWTVLLAASYFFYMYAGWRYVAFILLTTITTYGVAMLLHRMNDQMNRTLAENKKTWDRNQKKDYKAQMKRRKKWMLAGVLLLNFGILGFLKYYNMFAGGFSMIPGIQMPVLKLFLPLGISFYTFQSMGYVIDVFREKVDPEKNVFRLALFVSFFPQIIQGPISLYDQLAAQLYAPHRFKFERFKQGAYLILWGYFKKMVIADRAVTFIMTVQKDYAQYNGTVILMTVLMYAFQLYADFSAGIDISRGIAQILGIDMIENFKRPYFSISINDYWRRWHISLGGWMKNYIFYPLAMSKSFLNMSKKLRKRIGKNAAGAYVAKAFPTALASLITFMVVGIWHGANSRYLAFGLWNGGIIMLSLLFKPVFTKTKETLHIPDRCFPYRIFCMFRTFLIVLVGYVFDIAPNMSGAMDMMRRCITDFTFSLTAVKAQVVTLGLTKLDYVVLAAGMLVMFVVSVVQETHSKTPLRAMVSRKHYVLQSVLLLGCMLAIAVFGMYGPGYNACEFVYMQF